METALCALHVASVGTGTVSHEIVCVCRIRAFPCFSNLPSSVNEELLWIRSMFLGLPEPNRLVRGTDPALDPELNSYCFVTSLRIFIFEK
jgi:hypothetical protein